MKNFLRLLFVWVACLKLSNQVFGQTYSFTNSNTSTISTGAGAGASLYPQDIAVSGVPGTVTNVTITLVGLYHSFPRDLLIRVSDPTGAYCDVMRYCENGNKLTNVTYTFSTAASGYLSQNSFSPSGTYLPSSYITGLTNYTPAPQGAANTNLSNFYGHSPNGTWSLWVADMASGDGGALTNGWYLTIQTDNTPGREGLPPTWIFSVNDWERPNYADGLNITNAPFNCPTNGSVDAWPIFTNAIALTTNGTKLFIPKGRYKFSRTLDLGDSGPSYLNKSIAIVGEDMNSVFLDFTNSTGPAIWLHTASDLLYSAQQSITAGATAGSVAFTVPSVAGFSVGNYVYAGQQDDPAISWGWAGANTNWYQGVSGIITNITGSVIKINVPLDMDLTNSPQLFRYSSAVGGMGFENFSISYTNRQTGTEVGALSMTRATNSWAWRVRVPQWYNRGIVMQQCLDPYIEKCWVDPSSNIGSSTYAIQVTERCTRARVSWCLMDEASSGILVQGGSVYTALLYDFGARTWPPSFSGVDCLAGGILLHGYNPRRTLIEGCVVGSVKIDDVWGRNDGTAVVDSWLTRRDPALGSVNEVTSCIAGLEVMYGNRDTFMAGNVIGTYDQYLSGKNAGFPSGINGAGNAYDSNATNAANLRIINNWSYETRTLVSRNNDTWTNRGNSLYYTNRPPVSVLPLGFRWPLQNSLAAVPTNWLPQTYEFYGLPMPSPITHPATLYVATNGTAGGAGSLADPRDLPSMVARATTLTAAGDTVYLRGGTYAAQSWSVGGDPTNKLRFAAYPGERVTIDGQTLIAAGCTNVQFVGIEFTDSAKMTRAAAPQATINDSGGATGSGNEWIHCVVHDTRGALTGKVGDLFYGNLIYFYGTNSQEHAFYFSSQTSGIPSTNAIIQNVVWAGAGQGIHGYGGTVTTNYLIADNFVFGTEALTGNPQSGVNSILLGGGGPIRDVTISSNWIYESGSAGIKGMILGYGSASNHAINVYGNWVYGGPRGIYYAGKWTKITNVWNTVTATGSGQDVGFTSADANSITAGPYLWDTNTYFNSSTTPTFELTNASAASFATWKSTTGFDPASTSTGSSTPAAQTKILASAYDTNRVTVGIWNPASTASISVVLTNWLSTADIVVAHNAENYYGDKITFTNITGTLALPMTGRTVATPVGYSAPSTRFPQFGVWILERTGSDPLTLPTTTTGIIQALRYFWFK